MDIGSRHRTLRSPTHELSCRIFLNNNASITTLNAHHRLSLQRAALRILHTDHTEDTYAELLDGMPTTKAYRECFYSWKTHPSSRHSELSPGIHDKIREFRANFDIKTLQFSTSVGIRPLRNHIC